MSVGVISGATWTLTVGDFVTIVTLVLLFVELIKATRTGGSSIVDHALSMILFMVCLVEFLVVRQAATSVFFFILVVTLIDVIAGFSITIRAARRDFGFGGVGD
jgi:O-antigen ligase